MLKSKMILREISKILFLIFFIFLNISQITAQSDLVTNLPRIGAPKTTTYAGYINVNETVGANLFYLFWEAQNVTENTPIVLWLQGGPGCSSMFGSFVENGPYIIDSNGNFTENEFSWNLNAHTLYVDQPVGSGYSYVDQPIGYATNERTLGEELLRLLLGFFELHPTYQSLDFFIFGESYAGKYVPTIASVILENNSKVGKGSNQYINLKALGLGDGWVDPYLQASTYCVYLETEGLVTKEIVLQQLEDYKVYQNLSNTNQNIKANAYSYKMMMYCSFQGGILDVYDIRYHLGDDPTNGPNDALTSYLNEEEVMLALHAEHTYLSCGRISHLFLAEDENRSEKSVVGDLLTQNLPILLYNGDKDLTCNYLGTNLWSSQIGWSGQSAYNNSTKLDWYVNNQPAGYFKYASGLTHAIVYNAGHMVPYSQPKNALSLLQNYLLHYNSTLTMESQGEFNFL